jgi:predicted DNA-binding protein with PD1-like motif
MKATRLHHDAGQVTFALIFDKGDEVVGTLTAFARENRLSAAHFTAIGAFSEVTLGYFDKARKDYKRVEIGEQVEVLSLLGDVAQGDQGPVIHAHTVVGKPDATAWGGHLIAARVWPTLEVVLVESPRHLRRRMDEESGLALIDIGASR